MATWRLRWTKRRLQSRWLLSRVWNTPVNITRALTLTNVTKLPLKAAAIVTGMQQRSYFFCGVGQGGGCCLCLEEEEEEELLCYSASKLSGRLLHGTSGWKPWWKLPPAPLGSVLLGGTSADSWLAANRRDSLRDTVISHSRSETWSLASWRKPCSAEDYHHQRETTWVVCYSPNKKKSFKPQYANVAVIISIHLFHPRDKNAHQ